MEYQRAIHCDPELYNFIKPPSDRQLALICYYHEQSKAVEATPPKNTESITTSSDTGNISSVQDAMTTPTESADAVPRNPRRAVHPTTPAITIARTPKRAVHPTTPEITIARTPKTRRCRRTKASLPF